MRQRPFNILSIEHIGVAVKNMEGISSIFSDVLGLEFSGSEEVTDQKVITDIYQVDDSKLEFLKATTKDSPLARFIDKKGCGMHHIAFDVDDIEAELIRLKKEGFILINETAFTGADNKLVAFIHPKSCHGILVELCQEIKDNE